MKKFVLFLLLLVVAAVGISCAGNPTISPKYEGTVVQIKNSVPFSLLNTRPYPHKHTKQLFDTVSSPDIQTEPVKESPAEPNNFIEDVPLAREEQEWLQAACEEFDIPYALALGLIEKETTFRNIIGDDGASTGYMQIQPKWHWDRMERLGVTDLLEPSGSFRVGCDFLTELHTKYNDWSLALTVYNFGHDPGYITDYAKDVMENYARWQEIINNYI